MLKKWEKNEEKYKKMQAEWTEEKEKEAGENWEKLAAKIREAGRGVGKNGLRLNPEEEKEQYYRNCYNYLVLK